MTLEMIKERLKENGVPEELLYNRANSIIANMDYKKTVAANSLLDTIKERKETLDAKLNGGAPDSETESIKNNIEELYKELDKKLGIVKEIIADEPEIKKQTSSEQESLNTRLAIYQKQLSEMPEGSETSQNYKSTKRAIDKMLEQKAREENNENNSIFANNTFDNIKKYTTTNDFDKMTGKAKTKSIVKYPGVDIIKLDDVPTDAKEEEIEEPKPGLLKRAKEWVKNNKGKTAMIIGAAVILGIAVGAAIHYMATGDSSAIQSAQHLDVGSIAGQINDVIDETVRQTADVATNTDTSALFDPSVDLSQPGTQIFTDAYNADAGTNGLTPSIDNAYVGDLFNTQTGQYANVDPSSLTLDQINDLKAQGFDKALLTNDPNMIGQGGNAIAEANAASGFIK